MAVMPPILEVAGLSKSFGGLRAVRDVAFSAQAGEVLSLIGPNGAGKTTTFNLITGFVAPTAGAVRFEGRPITGLKPFAVARRGIVRTFQKTNVFAGISVLDNVMAAQYLLGRARPATGRLGRRELEVRADEILGLLRLEARRDRLAATLPYGDLRRLEIAIALAARPRLLLLDEPAAGLNGTEAAELVALLRMLIGRQESLAILLVEHNMNVVMQVSDRIVVLNFGQKIAEGTPAAIRDDPSVIDAYLGAPA